MSCGELSKFGVTPTNTLQQKLKTGMNTWHTSLMTLKNKTWVHKRLCLNVEPELDH